MLRLGQSALPLKHNKKEQGTSMLKSQQIVSAEVRWPAGHIGVLQ